MILVADASALIAVAPLLDQIAASQVFIGSELVRAVLDLANE